MDGKSSRKLRANFSSGDQIFAKGNARGDWEKLKELSNSKALKYFSDQTFHSAFAYIVCQQIKQLGFLCYPYRKRIIHKKLMIWGGPSLRTGSLKESSKRACSQARGDQVFFGA